MRSPADAAPSFLFAPDLGAPGSVVVLSSDESHYLTRVCRVRAGDRVSATDGRGGHGILRITSAGNPVRAEVESLERVERTRRAWVWCGAPEGRRADWLVEKLSELGVAVFQPLQCERGFWSPRANRRERLQRLAIAGMRQSRRSFLMDVREPVDIETALMHLPDDCVRWLASPEGGTPGFGADRAALSLGAIGPAGGFATVEREALGGAGFRPISLGDGRLRTETAALAWALWWFLQ